MPTTGKLDHSEETVRLLATLVRMKTESQAEAIAELGKAGFGTARIAELLGTTTATVNVAQQRARKAAKKATELGKAKPRSKGRGKTK